MVSTRRAGGLSRGEASRGQWWVGFYCPPLVPTELKDRLQSSFQTSRTPWTFDPLTSGFDAQISGMAGAASVIILSMFAHAFRRAVRFVTPAAVSIAALIFGSSSCAQLTLLTGTIVLPLNGTYRYA